MDQKNELVTLKRQVERLFAVNLIQGMALIESAERMFKAFHSIPSMTTRDKMNIEQWQNKLAGFKKKQHEYAEKSIQAYDLEVQLTSKKAII